MDDRLLKSYRALTGPAWRWELAATLQQDPTAPLAAIADATVKSAIAYIDRRLAEDVPPDVGDPDDDGGPSDWVDRAPSREKAAPPETPEEAETRFRIAAARSLWDDADLREKFSVLVLGDCSVEEIASRLAVDVEVVRQVEDLFFEVRSTRSATDWVNVHVIRTAEGKDAARLACRYRAAFWGGPLVARDLLDAESRVSLDPVQAIADRERLLDMKAHAALEMPLDDPQLALKFLKLKLDHDHQMQRLELSKQQFRHRAEQDICKRKLAERRLESFLNREEVREQREHASQKSRRMKQAAAVAHAAQQARMLEGEHEEAARRAMVSPLAQLTWSGAKPTPECDSRSADDSDLVNNLPAKRGTSHDVLVEAAA